MGTWITQWATTIWIIPAAVSSTAAATAAVSPWEKTQPNCSWKASQSVKSHCAFGAAPYRTDDFCSNSVSAHSPTSEYEENKSKCLFMPASILCRHSQIYVWIDIKEKSRHLTRSGRARSLPISQDTYIYRTKNCDATKQNQPQDYRRISRSRQQSTSVTLKTGSHIWHVCSVSGTRF